MDELVITIENLHQVRYQLSTIAEHDMEPMLAAASPANEDALADAQTALRNAASLLDEAMGWIERAGVHRYPGDYGDDD